MTATYAVYINKISTICQKQSTFMDIKGYDFLSEVEFLCPFNFAKRL